MSRFGESCKIIIDLTKSEFSISEKYDALVYDYLFSLFLFISDID